MNSITAGSAIPEATEAAAQEQSYTIALLKQGIIPRMKFEVTIFMESEKTFDSFAQAVKYFYQRVKEAAPGSRHFSTFWIGCLIDEKAVAPLMPWQVWVIWVCCR